MNYRKYCMAERFVAEQRSKSGVKETKYQVFLLILHATNISILQNETDAKNRKAKVCHEWKYR